MIIYHETRYFSILSGIEDTWSCSWIYTPILGFIEKAVWRYWTTLIGYTGQSGTCNIQSNNVTWSDSAHFDLKGIIHLHCRGSLCGDSLSRLFSLTSLCYWYLKRCRQLDRLRWKHTTMCTLVINWMFSRYIEVSRTVTDMAMMLRKMYEGHELF